MTWQLFTLISIISLSFSVVLQRVLLHTHKTNPYAYAIVFQGTVGVLLLLVAGIVGFRLPNFAPLIVPAAISVVCFGVGHIFYAKTLQRVEASSFSVLFSTQAVWTMILGIVLLHESMTILQVFGTVAIFTSVFLLAKNPRAIFRDKGTLLGLLTGLLFGVAIYFWSYVGRHTDALSWAAISFVLTAIVVLVARPNALRAMAPFKHPAVLSKMIALAFLYGLGSLTMMYAYKYGSFAVVSPLRQTSIIITVLLALIFLSSERHSIGKKVLAAVVCTFGVVLIIL